MGVCPLAHLRYEVATNSNEIHPMGKAASVIANHSDVPCFLLDGPLTRYFYQLDWPRSARTLRTFHFCLLTCDGPVTPWQWTDDISAAADRSANSFITSLYNPKPSHCNLLNSRTLPKVHVVWHSAYRAYLQKELKLASFLCLQMRQAWKHLETDLFGW